MSANMSIQRTERKSMAGCLPMPSSARIDAWRDELRQLPEYDAYQHDAKIIRGITFVKQFIARPIPRHRALSIIPGPAGVLRVLSAS